MNFNASRCWIGFGLAMAVLLDTATQLLWKVGAAAAPARLDWWSAITALLRQPVLLIVAALMGLQYLNWMAVLRRVDLSYAHSFTSLSYVTVAVASVLLLGEHLDVARILGIGLILAGVWLVGVGGRPAARLRRVVR